jgi:hypothetical protein
MPKERCLVERVPFSRDEEQTISSMARWMRFMAVVGIIGGIMILVSLVLGIGLHSATRSLSVSSTDWAKLQKVFDELGPTLYFVAGAFLLVAVISLWQAFVLYHAGDYFNQVAQTDVADVDYLARGLDKLRTYYKIQVLVVLVTVAVAFGAGATLAVLTRQGQ